MAGKFFVEIDGMYLRSDGEGGLLLVDTIEEAEWLESYESAEGTALGFTKDGWRIIER